MKAIGQILNSRKWQPSKLETLEGLPIRPSVKKTRLYLDREYFECGYAARFKGKITAVYCVLAMFANHKRQTCWPSAKTIMELCGITNRGMLFRALKLLEAYDIIAIVHRSKGRVPNVYALLTPSHWKPINSSNFDTVMQQVKKKRTVSNAPAQQCQNQPTNSGSTDTRSQLTKSDNEINQDLTKKEESETDKKTETIKSKLLQQLRVSTKAMVIPYFREEDIVATLAVFEESGTPIEELGYKQLIEELLKRGAIPKTELPSWMNIKR